jgi:hypothetical protein
MDKMEAKLKQFDDIIHERRNSNKTHQQKQLLTML